MRAINTRKRTLYPVLKTLEEKLPEQLYLVITLAAAKRDL